ncbi:MAG: purine-nucleoside phosphorylase [Bacteroidota bacterium]|nr:purine-nucleoside phosphorylase [Bacteroidota bacterium]
MNTQLQDSIEYLRSKITRVPEIAVVLGSGLGDFAKQIKNPVVIPTSEIPHYPISTVQGHAGKIIFGTLESDDRKSNELIVFQGRIHLYESNDIQKVVYPIRIAAELGVQKLIVTNAAGGINRNFDSGTLMFIRDYINLTGENPLIGTKELNETTSLQKYPTLSTSLLNKAKSIAEMNGILTKEGVYCWTKGPSYETAAEIRMMASMGADAVGMSTVPEIIVAHNYGIEILGISCITNMATGISLTKLNHEEVTETANRVKNDFTKLVNEIIFEMG